MPSRRQIREAIVQFLYASGPEGIPTPADESPSLQLVLEPLARKIPVARAKALVHLQQGREKIAARLQPFARDIAIMAARAESELPPVSDLLTAEEELAEVLESIRRELNGNRDPARLSELLDDCRRGEDASRSAQARFEQADPDLPGLEKLRSAALAETAGLPEYRDRFRAAFRAEESPHPEVSALQRTIRAHKVARERIETIVRGLAAHLADLDKRIAAAVENYAPERLDRVDRAILRLATYEMLHESDVPAPVAIDEAIELARSFGTTDSPAFVNGVLDRIRKTARPESRTNQ